jgi:exodeoxyribonuclease VII large subunit
MAKPDNPLSPDRRQIFTVSELNQQVNELLSLHFPLVWVSGEISNLSQAPSGHAYFTLKDARAEVSCALFRLRRRQLKTPLTEGLQVLVQAQVALYQNRGRYQLLIEYLEPAGEGLLQQAFRQLQQRLEQEGLFDQKHKQPLPKFPKRLGVITSPTGAVIRDILQVLKRRYPCLPVVVYPTPVQGKDAAPGIVQAIELANQQAYCDLLIVARGGGSLEDLWAFNKEAVARAIFASDIPIVSAVGHETDTSIADYVADLRAATPSVAAELVSPDGQQLHAELQQQADKLAQTLKRQINQRKQQLAWLKKGLNSGAPDRQLPRHNQLLDELVLRLNRTVKQKIGYRQQLVQHYQRQLAQLSPRQRLAYCQSQAVTLQQRLQHALTNQLKARHPPLNYLQQRLVTSQAQHVNALRNQWLQLSQALANLSPLATLQRGYAIVQDQQQQIVRDSQQVQPEDKLRVRLAKGELAVNVKQCL